jgi:hypothetical protein
MLHQRRSRLAPARRSTRAVASAVCVVVGLMAIYSCSLIVETSSQQCQKDGDCLTFSPTATCDPSTHVCVPGTSSSSGTGTTSSSGGTGCNVDGGIDGGGCYSSACAATTNPEILNACTTGCIPFDNAARVPGLLPGDQLPDLPVPGPDGGF